MAHATIRDVAREAAVSIASVSRALNGHSNVHPQTRDHIRSVADRLGYVPHAGARNLSLARSGLIGVILPDLHGEFFSELLRGMDREASDHCLRLLLMVMHGDAQRGVDTLNTLRGSVDGLVVMAPQVSAEDLLGHLPGSMPVILVSCAADASHLPRLGIDNAGASGAMVEHLLATGRRRLVHIAGPEGNVDAEERRRGAEQACARAGVALTVLPGDFHEASGVAAAERLLADGMPADAIFAANDMMAIGALMTLRRAGVAVPDQVAVAGFDDIPLARLVTPSLTTASVDIAGFGARAVARLAHMLDGRADASAELCAARIVVRESSA
jgi:LacI family transcriptional regulator